MQIFRLSYQEITFLCLLNIQTICYRVNLHGLLACCSCLAGGASSVMLGSSRATQAQRSAQRPGSLGRIRVLILGCKMPT